MAKEKSNIEIVGVDVLLKAFKALQKNIAEGQIPFMLAGDLKILILNRLKKGMGVFEKFEPYGTEPYYRDKSQRPIGKGGRRKTRTGKTMATIYYEGGYKQFAAATKGSSTVNLIASGAMIRDMQAAVVNSNTARIVFNQQREALKALQLTRIKGAFMGANPLEQEKLSSNVVKIVNRLTKQLGLT